MAKINVWLTYNNRETFKFSVEPFKQFGSNVVSDESLEIALVSLDSSISSVLYRTDRKHSKFRASFSFEDFEIDELSRIFYSFVELDKKDKIGYGLSSFYTQFTGDLAKTIGYLVIDTRGTNKSVCFLEEVEE